MMIGSELLPSSARADAPSRPPSAEDHQILQGLLQHLGSALVVAALMGLTYEILMERRRHRNHSEEIAETEGAVFRAIAGLTQFNAARLLELLQDVARNIELQPTLFSPARLGSECLFATNPKHFDHLIDSARADVIRIVETWLRGDNPNLRFLGSDFVGKYRLDEFLPQMRESADQVWLKHDWDRLEPRVKSWVLNYFWAVSLAEGNKLRRLIDILVGTRDPFTRRWILHLPVQMPEIDGAFELVDAFLAAYVHRPTMTEELPRGLFPPEDAQPAILALAAIEHHHRTRRSDDRGRAIELLRSQRNRFVDQAAFVRRTWLGLGITPDDLPPLAESRSARIVRAGNEVVCFEDEDMNIVEAEVLAPPVRATPSINDTAFLFGTKERGGRFVAAFAEFPDGLVAPVLSIKRPTNEAETAK